MNWSIVMFVVYGLGSLFFLAGSIIGLLQALRRVTACTVCSARCWCSYWSPSPVAW